MADELTVGNPKEWGSFAERNKVLLERLPNLTRALNEILNRKWTSEEPIDLYIFIAGHMAIDDFMEIMTLAANSESYGAEKILRPMFERVVTLKYLFANPKEYDKFRNYYWVTKHKLSNAIETTFLKGLIPKKELTEIKEHYDKVKGDYKMTLCETCKTTRPGIAWTPVDMVAMARTVGMGAQLVPDYYIPLDQCHPNVKAMLDRVEIRDGRIVLKERLDRTAADHVLRAHILALQALEVQVKHFRLDTAVYDTAEKDLIEIWKIPSPEEAEKLLKGVQEANEG